MQINMLMHADRPFFHKVVQKAERQIQPVLDSAAFPVPYDYAAEFDSATTVPKLIHQYNKKLNIHAIRFGAAQWEPGKSTQDAVNQIASVLVIQYPNQPLAEPFRAAGITVGPARRFKHRLPNETLDHATVFITSDLTIDMFFHLADQVDSLVATSRTGDVSGTGCGIGGWCLDLTSKTIEKCVDFVSKELQSRSLEFTVERSAV